MSEETTTDVELLPAAGAIEALTRAEVDIQIATAHKYPKHTTPKDIERFQNDLMAMVTTDEDTAESCLYTLPRKKEVVKNGKKVWVPIEGRSVRFAEMCQSTFGNLRSATRIIEEGQSHVTVEGRAHDLERNVAVSVEIRRRITYADGRRYNEDLITLTCNAAGAIAYRNVTFKVVPAALTQAAYIAAKALATGGALPIETRIARMLKKFALMGVFDDRVLYALGKAKTSDINQDDLASLVGLFNAIKTGEQDIDLAFPQPPDTATVSIDDVTEPMATKVRQEELKERAKRSGKKAAPQAPEEPETAAETSTAPEPTPSGIPPEVFDQLGKADKDVAGHVWRQALAAGWDASDFLSRYESFVEEGQSAAEALATMMAKFNEAEGESK